MGTCVGQEVCNSCDDDGDGLVDEKCALGTGPFNALQCSGSVTIPQFELDSLAQFERDPDQANVKADTYNNSIDFRWGLFANSFVDAVRLHFAAVDFEDNDFLVITSTNVLRVIHTNSTPRWHDFSVPGAAANPGLQFNVLTNEKESARGFLIDVATVTCSAAGSTQPPPLLLPLKRTEGFLVGTGDTLYFQLQGTSHHLYVWLEGFPKAAPTDFDMYLRRGALPERDRFDWRSINETTAVNRNDEALRIDADTSGDDLFLAVTSHNGAGWFRLWYSYVLDGEIRGLTAGTESPQPPEVMEEFQTALERAQRRYFAANEGQRVIGRIELFDSPAVAPCTCGGASCDICFTNTPGGVSSSPRRANPCAEQGPGTGVRMSRDSWVAAGVIAHELGHCPGGIGDEYAPHHLSDASNTYCGHNDGWCGHSIYSNDRYSKSVDYCSASNHGRDLITRPGGELPENHVCPKNCGVTGVPPRTASCDDTCVLCISGQTGGGPFQRGTSIWESLHERGVVALPVTRTPDHHSLEDFSGFGALMETVRR